MAMNPWQSFFDSTRGRVVAFVRQEGSATVDAIAAALGLSANAVRMQLAVLERDGLIRRGGVRQGMTKPAQMYEVAPALEQLLSRAYIPLTAQLLQLLTARLPDAELTSLMREAGEGLAATIPSAARPTGTLGERVAGMSRLLNDEIGAVTHVEQTGPDSFRLQGQGCPLAALTGSHPSVCLAVERLIAVTIGAAVRQCCDISARPRCCFAIREHANR